MAEDIERTNAREWDMNLRAYENKQLQGSNQPATESTGGWTVVEGNNRAQKSKQQRSSPASHASHQKQHHLPAKQEKLPPKQHTSPRKWINTRAQRLESKPRRLPPNLTLDADNEGQQLWRNRVPPNGTIQIPDELALQDRAHIEALAHQNGTFIFSEHDKGMNGIMTFGLWGEDHALTVTKRVIDAWISEWKQASRSKSRRSAAFAKIHSLTPELRKRKESQWLREVKKQRFRQHPPPGSEFEAIGNFHWPVHQYRPEEVLGTSYEALDPIRVDCECYVIFEKDRSTFRVLGKAKEVQVGLLRLRKTCLQIAARGINEVREYFLQCPVGSNMFSHVVLKAYDHPNTISNEIAMDHSPGNMPYGEGLSGDESRVYCLEAEESLDEQRISTLLTQTLKKLHYYRGEIQMRIHLGAFLATQFRKPKNEMYELEEYKAMIKETQFIGRVTKELGDKGIEYEALSTLQDSDGLLLPEDAITTNLAEVRPVYSVTFTFADDAGDLCFTRSWRETEDVGARASSFEEISKKWTRLERDTGERGTEESSNCAAVPLLDLTVSDLSTGMAWHFGIEASQAVDEIRLPKALSNFGYSVTIDPAAALNPSPDKPFVKYNPYAVKLKRMEQRFSYRYHIRTEDGFVTDYTLDLTRFQDRIFPLTKMTLLATAPPKVYEPRWSIDVYRTDWNNMFSKNANLKIGEVADWKHNIDTWFPADTSETLRTENKGVGIEQLMEKLKRIAKLVEEMKDDNLMGGMTVG